MRISDWSSDVCSSDLLHGVDVGRAGVAGNLPRDLRLAVEILLVAHPLEDLERGFLRHRARFALRHPQLLGIESYLGIARLEVLHDGLQRRIGELRSEEHTSELQSLMRISYAVFCLKKQNKQKIQDISYIYHT